MITIDDMNKVFANVTLLGKIFFTKLFISNTSDIDEQGF